MRASALLLALLLQSAPAPAAIQARLTLRDVRACLPLRDGGVLAGTPGGLMRLDADLEVRRAWGPADGLPSATIHTIAAEGETRWIGTGGGLAEAREVGEELEILRVFPSAPVRAVLPHPEGLLVATWGGGVMQLDGRGRLVHLPAERGPRPSSAAGWTQRAIGLAVVNGRYFAAFTGDGVYEIRGGALHRLPLHLPAVMALVGHDGALYVATLGGLFRVDGEAAIRVHDLDARWLTSSEAGLLAATYGQGAVRVGARRTKVLLDGGRYANTVTRRHGVTCVGTRDGLWLLRDGASRRAALAGPASPDISAMQVDGDRVWVGTFDAGVGYLDAAGWHAVADPLIDRRVNALAVEKTSDGSRVWIGTARGLSVLEAGRVRRLTRADGLPHDEIHALATLRRGGVLAGTGVGAVVVRGDRLRVLGRKQGLPKRAVWAVAEGSEGGLLLGTTVGLYRLRGSARPERLSVASGHLDGDWITALAVQGDTLWVGTYSHGVTRLEGPTLAATHLGGGYVNLGGLLLRGHRVYAATMGGLKSTSAREPGPWTTHAGAAPGRDVTAAVAGGGAVWVGSRQGLGRL